MSRAKPYISTFLTETAFRMPIFAHNLTKSAPNLSQILQIDINPPASDLYASQG
jgi:hypothetical protein